MKCAPTFWLSRVFPPWRNRKLILQGKASRGQIQSTQRHKVSTGMENRMREATMHELLRGKRGGGHTPVAFALPPSLLLLFLLPLPFLLRVRLFSASWSRRRPWGGIHQIGIFTGKKTAPKVRTNATLPFFPTVQQPVDKVSLFFCRNSIPREMRTFGEIRPW